jgi:hypothetical protein
MSYLRLACEYDISVTEAFICFLILTALEAFRMAPGFIVETGKPGA